MSFGLNTQAFHQGFAEGIQEYRQQFNQVDNAFKQQFAGVEQSFKQQFEETGKAFQSRRTELRNSFDEIKNDFQRDDSYEPSLGERVWAAICNFFKAIAEFFAKPFQDEYTIEFKLHEHNHFNALENHFRAIGDDALANHYSSIQY